MTTRAYDYDGETGRICLRSLAGRMRAMRTRRASQAVEGSNEIVLESGLGGEVGSRRALISKAAARTTRPRVARATSLITYLARYSTTSRPLTYRMNFFIGGKKMASSKAVAPLQRNVRSFFPAEIFRLVLIGKDIREQIDVDPSGESVPRLYDWYDELAEGMREGKVDDYSPPVYTLRAPGESRRPLDRVADAIP